MILQPLNIQVFAVTTQVTSFNPTSSTVVETTAPTVGVAARCRLSDINLQEHEIVIDDRKTACCKISVHLSKYMVQKKITTRAGRVQDCKIKNQNYDKSRTESSTEKKTRNSFKDKYIIKNLL